MKYDFWGLTKKGDGAILIAGNQLRSLGERMNYFLNYYVHLCNGVSYILRDLFFVTGFIALLSEINFTSLRSLLSFLGKLIVFWLLLIVLSSAYTVVFGTQRLILVVYPFVLFLFALLFSKLRASSRITLAVCFYMLFFYSIHSIDLAYTVITGGEAFNPNGSWNYFFETIRCLCFFIATVAVFTYLRVCSIEEYTYVNHSGVVILFLTVSLMAILPEYAEKGTDFQNFVANALLLLIQIFAYYMFYASTKEHNIRLEAQMIHAHKDAMNEQIHLTECNREEIMILRHEIKNQFGYMKSLLSDQNYDGLNRFFQEFEEKKLGSLEYIDSGNYMVDAVLNMELEKIKYRGYSLERKIAVSASFGISESDFCSVLANLMDNAVEYCSRAGFPPETVVIGAEIRLENQSLFIRVTNPIRSEDEERAVLLKTTKSQRRLHGYGTQIVQKNVEDYGGSLRYEVVDSIFVADVLMFVKDKESENDQ